MRCPVCGGKTRQVDAIYPFKGKYSLKKRRHECLHCGYRFNTYQEVEER